MPARRRPRTVLAGTVALVAAVTWLAMSDRTVSGEADSATTGAQPPQGVRHGEAGVPLHVRPCEPADPDQLWEWTVGPSQVLRSKRGTCLDIPGSEYRMGATPFAHDCDGHPNQQWLARPT